MAYNDAIARRRFQAHWEQLRQEYRDAGMSEESIDAIYQFDLAFFRDERNNKQHQASLPYTNIEDIEDGVDSSNAELKISRFLESETIPNGFYDTSRYGWIDEIENQALVKRLKKLKAADLELLTQYVFDEKTQSEIAEEYGLSQNAIWFRIKRIKNFLKKF